MPENGTKTLSNNDDAEKIGYSRGADEGRVIYDDILWTAGIVKNVPESRRYCTLCPENCLPCFGQ